MKYLTLITIIWIIPRLTFCQTSTPIVILGRSFFPLEVNTAKVDTFAFRLKYQFDSSEDKEIQPLNIKSSFKEAPQVPLAYSYDQLGIFCKFEVQIEKVTKWPIKVRLGEVQYVERLEGKY